MDCTHIYFHWKNHGTSTAIWQSGGVCLLLRRTTEWLWTLVRCFRLGPSFSGPFLRRPSGLLNRGRPRICGAPFFRWGHPALAGCRAPFVGVHTVTCISTQTRTNTHITYTLHRPWMWSSPSRGCRVLDPAPARTIHVVHLATCWEKTSV